MVKTDKEVTSVNKENFYKKKSKNDNDHDIEKIAICEWYSYNGRRCRRGCSNNSEFCNLHNVLKDDYKILKKEKECCEQRNIKLIPRSKKYIKGMMKKLGYEDTDKVDVYLPGGAIEEGSIDEESFIELSLDETRYYYEAKKGEEKAKTLRIVLTEECNNSAIVSVKDENYCYDCYVKKAKKIGYPHLKLYGYKKPSLLET